MAKVSFINLMFTKYFNESILIKNKFWIVKKVPTVLAIHGLAICRFDYSHSILKDPNTSYLSKNLEINILGFAIHIQNNLEHYPANREGNPHLLFSCDRLLNILCKCSLFCFMMLSRNKWIEFHFIYYDSTRNDL